MLNEKVKSIRLVIEVFIELCQKGLSSEQNQLNTAEEKNPSPPMYFDSNITLLCITTVYLSAHMSVASTEWLNSSTVKPYCNSVEPAAS